MEIAVDLLRIIIAILLPPLGVFLQVGIGKQFWINVSTDDPRLHSRYSPRGVGHSEVLAPRSSAIGKSPPGALRARFERRRELVLLSPSPMGALDSGDGLFAALEAVVGLTVSPC